MERSPRGISVALALSLPGGGHHDLIVTVTYIVVALSIIVQGLSVGPLARRLAARDAARQHYTRPFMEEHLVAVRLTNTQRVSSEISAAARRARRAAIDPSE